MFTTTPKVAKAHKFTKSIKHVQCLEEFSRLVKAGGWIFWGNRTRATHSAIMASMQFRIVDNAIRRGLMFHADRNPSSPYEVRVVAMYSPATGKATRYLGYCYEIDGGRAISARTITALERKFMEMVGSAPLEFTQTMGSKEIPW